MDDRGTSGNVADSEPDWIAHYQREAEFCDFTPNSDALEIHRCLAAWSVFPKRPGVSLLDAGCGNGFFCHWIAERCQPESVTGVDVSAPRVEIARQRYPEFAFVEGDLARLPFADSQFDVVTCIEVLEHMQDPAAVLRELVRVARRHIVITVPDRQPIRMVLCPHCGKQFPEHGHIQTFDRHGLEALLRSVGAEPEACRPYHLPCGLRWGLPFWLGRIFTRIIQWIRPNRAMFLAVRARVHDGD